jgi:hypothetical protein
VFDALASKRIESAMRRSNTKKKEEEKEKEAMIKEAKDFPFSLYL